MKTEKFLPVGSVVLLKESTKRVMIIGFLQARPQERDVVYDYSGCLYPEGYQDAEHVYLFNHDQIETIYSVGYLDEEQFAFDKRLQDAQEKISTRASQ